MITITSSDKNATSTLLVAAATTISLGFVGYHYGIVKRKEPRKAKVACVCGKIEIAIEQPPANYSYMDAHCIQCTCKDCLGFCEEVIKQGTTKLTLKDLGQPGVSTTAFYDSELQVVKGQEYLESMKFSEKSENRRIYSSCCGTPIAISVEGSPINLVYCSNITPEKKENSVNMEACCCFHSRKEDVVPPGSNIRMLDGAFAPRTILSILSRFGFLAFVGSYGPGSGIPVSDGKTVGIGMESIKVKG